MLTPGTHTLEFDFKYDGGGGGKGGMATISVNDKVVASGRITKTQEKNRNESIEENLEKLAALNLSNDQSMQPRFSTAMIRLVSAAAGIGALLLIYLVVKLFY